MKRTLLALLVGLSLLLSLAACGSGRTSAQEVTEQGLAALRDLDVLALPQYWNTDGLNLDDLGDLSQAGEELDLSAEDTAALAQAMTRHLSWQVISAQEDPARPPSPSPAPTWTGPRWWASSSRRPFPTP